MVTKPAEWQASSRRSPRVSAEIGHGLNLVKNMQ